jgi:hypothetical protein
MTATMEHSRVGEGLMADQPIDVPYPTDWLSPAEACVILSVTPTTLWRMVKAELLTPRKIGGLTVYWRPQVERLAAARRIARGQ